MSHKDELDAQTKILKTIPKRYNRKDAAAHRTGEDLTRQQVAKLLASHYDFQLACLQIPTDYGKQGCGGRSEVCGTSCTLVVADLTLTMADRYTTDKDGNITRYPPTLTDFLTASRFTLRYSPALIAYVEHGGTIGGNRTEQGKPNIHAHALAFGYWCDLHRLREGWVHTHCDSMGRGAWLLRPIPITDTDRLNGAVAAHRSTYIAKSSAHMSKDYDTPNPIIVKDRHGKGGKLTIL